MKVELSIKDDRELRNLIKDMIEGQVKGLIRENIDRIVVAEACRLMKNKFDGSIYSIESAFLRLMEENSAAIRKEIVREEGPKLAKRMEAPLVAEVKRILSQDIGIILGQEIRKKAASVPINIVLGEEVKENQ